MCEANHKYKVYKDNPERAKLMTDMLLNELGIRDYRGHVLTTDGIIEDESITLALPDASSDEETKKAYRDQVNALKRKEFSALIGDFKDELCEWDVLNEATARHKMYDVYGIDIYKEWYDMAREYAGPNLPLYYNEARLSDENFYKLLDEMVEADIDFQGIGLETHYGFKKPSLFDNILKKVSTYGKTIKITEYDDTCTNPNLQANLLRDMLILAYSYESVDAFIMWGFNDSSHWLGNAPIFYEDWTLKPSGKMFIDLVYNKWWTNEEGYTDLNGQFSFSGFNGDYKISVTIDGKTKTEIKSISKNKNNIIEIII